MKQDSNSVRRYKQKDAVKLNDFSDSTYLRLSVCDDLHCFYLDSLKYEETQHYFCVIVKMLVLL